MCIMYTKENIYIKQNLMIITLLIIKDDRIYYLEDQ